MTRIIAVLLVLGCVGCDEPPQKRSSAQCWYDEMVIQRDAADSLLVVIDSLEQEIDSLKAVKK